MRFPRLEVTRVMSLAVIGWTLAAFCASAGEAGTASSAESPRYIALAIDDSGSMQTTDPDGLSKQAAELFFKLLDPSDSVAFLSFSDRARERYPLVPLKGPRQLNRLISKLRVLKRRGAHTNIEAALKSAGDLLDGKQGPKAILLLTDGRIDFDNEPETESAEESLSRKRVLNLLAPELGRRDVRIYPISFGADTDEAFLSELAKISRGQSFVIRKPEAIAEAYFKVFNEISAPQMVPIQGGVFSIDASVDEATVLARYTGDQLAFHLVSPDGVRHRFGESRKKVKWGGNKAYGMATLQQPLRGSWRIEGLRDQDANIVILTDVKLKAAINKSIYAKGEPIKIAATLDGQADVPKLLFSATLVDEAGHILTDSKLETLPGGAGIGGFFSLPELEPGEFSVHVEARAETFVRERFFSIRIRNELWLKMGDPQEADGSPMASFVFSIAPDERLNGDAELEGAMDLLRFDSARLTIKSPKAETVEAQLQRVDNEFLAQLSTGDLEGECELNLTLQTKPLSGKGKPFFASKAFHYYSSMAADVAVAPAETSLFGLDLGGVFGVLALLLTGAVLIFLILSKRQLREAAMQMHVHSYERPSATIDHTKSLENIAVDVKALDQNQQKMISLLVLISEIVDSDKTEASVSGEEESEPEERSEYKGILKSIQKDFLEQERHLLAAIEKLSGDFAQKQKMIDGSLGHHMDKFDTISHRLEKSLSHREGPAHHESRAGESASDAIETLSGEMQKNYKRIDLTMVNYMEMLMNISRQLEKALGVIAGLSYKPPSGDAAVVSGGLQESTKSVVNGATAQGSEKESKNISVEGGMGHMMEEIDEIQSVDPEPEASETAAIKTNPEEVGGSFMEEMQMIMKDIKKKTQSTKKKTTFTKESPPAENPKIPVDLDEDSIQLSDNPAKASTATGTAKSKDDEEKQDKNEILNLIEKLEKIATR